MSKKTFIIIIFSFFDFINTMRATCKNKIMTSIDKNSNSATDLSWTNLTLDEKIGQMILSNVR